ncbi:MAG: hypothetical protein R3F45_07740 [Gammaproteobacteria bacterium]
MGVTALALIVTLHACTGTPTAGHAPPPVSATTNLTGGTGFQIQLPAFVERPRPGDFSICHGNTCAKRARISLSDSDWDQVRTILREPAPDAGTERVNIAAAVALLESMVGLMTGTDADLGKDDGMGRPGQLDCDWMSQSPQRFTYHAADRRFAPPSQRGRSATRGPFTGLLAQWFYFPRPSCATRSPAWTMRIPWFRRTASCPDIVPMSDWWRAALPPGCGIGRTDYTIAGISHRFPACCTWCTSSRSRG